MAVSSTSLLGSLSEGTVFAFPETTNPEAAVDSNPGVVGPGSVSTGSVISTPCGITILCASPGELSSLRDDIMNWSGESGSASWLAEKASLSYCTAIISKKYSWSRASIPSDIVNWSTLFRGVPVNECWGAFCHVQRLSLIHI